MGWSVSIGSIAGTAIRLHITFLLFLAWIFVASYASEGAEAAWTTLTFLLLLFACVVAHEFGHIFMARRFGVLTPTVTLLPIGGVAQLERMPERPWEEFLVAVAGPAVNVAIASVLIWILGASLDTANLSIMEKSSISMVDRLAVVNVFLVLFNMIPAFPMDGGRVLRAALASRLGFARATEIAAKIGQFVAFVLGFIGLFGNPLLIFIAIFVYLAAASEAQLVAVRSISRDVPVNAAMMTQFATLSPDATINEAIETLLRTSQSEFPVVDGASRPIGVLDRSDLIRALKQIGPDALVVDAMANPLPTVNHRSRLDEAFKILRENRASAVGVVNSGGQLTGLVTTETIVEMLMMRDAIPRQMRLGEKNPEPWKRHGES